MANGFANGEYPNMPAWPSGYPGLAPGAMVRSLKKYILWKNLNNEYLILWKLLNSFDTKFGNHLFGLLFRTLMKSSPILTAWQSSDGLEVFDKFFENKSFFFTRSGKRVKSDRRSFFNVCPLDCQIFDTYFWRIL